MSISLMKLLYKASCLPPNILTLSQAKAGVGSQKIGFFFLKALGQFSYSLVMLLSCLGVLLLVPNDT